MSATAAIFTQRNIEIGQILAEARTKAHLSVSECAQVIGTSRRRYADMEQGKVAISVAELEVLLRFLKLAPTRIWPDLQPDPPPRQVVIAAQPGETVQVVFAVG